MILSSFVLFLISSGLVSAIEYTRLEPNAFPSVTSPSESNLADFLGQIFNFGIAVAVVLALIMIILGGIMYMTTDSWEGKEEGKTKIKDALWGLGLALVSYLILFTINPCLVVFTNKDGCSTTNTFLFGSTMKKPGGVGSARLKPCLQCVDASNSGLTCKDENSCQLNVGLASKLSLALKGQSARITEAYPPTVPHKDSCHYDGSCADVNFNNQSTNPVDVKRLYDSLKSKGLNVSYESNDCPRYEAEKINCNIYETTRGVHFHVEK